MRGAASGGESRRGGALLAPALIGTVSAVLSAIYLSRKPLWRDEVASLVAFQRTLPQLHQLSLRQDRVFLPYYLFGHVWVLVSAGNGWLRLPSLLGAAVASAAAVAIARRFVSLQWSVAAGLVCLATPLLQVHSQEVRSYTISAGFSTLALLLYLRVRDAPSRKNATTFAALGVLAVAAHLFVGLVATTAAVLLLLRRDRRSRISGLVVIAGTLAWGAFVAKQSTQVSYLPRSGLHSVLDVTNEVYGFNSKLRLVAVLLMVIGVASAVMQREWVFLEVVVAGVAPTVVLIVAGRFHPLYNPRYSVSIVPVLAIMTAAGAAAIARSVSRPLRLVPAFIVAGVLVLSVGNVLHTAEKPSMAEDFDTLAHETAVRVSPGDAIVYAAPPSELLRRTFVRSLPASAAADLDDVLLDQTGAASGTFDGTTVAPAQRAAQLRAAHAIFVVERSDMPATELHQVESVVPTERAVRVATTTSYDVVMLAVQPHG